MKKNSLYLLFSFSLNTSKYILLAFFLPIPRFPVCVVRSKALHLVVCFFYFGGVRITHSIHGTIGKNRGVSIRYIITPWIFARGCEIHAHCSNTQLRWTFRFVWTRDFRMQCKRTSKFRQEEREKRHFLCRSSPIPLLPVSSRFPMLIFLWNNFFFSFFSNQMKRDATTYKTNSRRYGRARKSSQRWSEMRQMYTPPKITIMSPKYEVKWMNDEHWSIPLNNVNKYIEAEKW